MKLEVDDVVKITLNETWSSQSTLKTEKKSTEQNAAKPDMWRIITSALVRSSWLSGPTNYLSFTEIL